MVLSCHSRYDHFCGVFEAAEKSLEGDGGQKVVVSSLVMLIVLIVYRHFRVDLVDRFLRENSSPQALFAICGELAVKSFRASTVVEGKNSFFNKRLGF